MKPAKEKNYHKKPGAHTHEPHAPRAQTLPWQLGRPVDSRGAQLQCRPPPGQGNPRGRLAPRDSCRLGSWQGCSRPRGFRAFPVASAPTPAPAATGSELRCFVLLAVGLHLLQLATGALQQAAAAAADGLRPSLRLLLPGSWSWLQAEKDCCCCWRFLHCVLEPCCQR